MNSPLHGSARRSEAGSTSPNQAAIFNAAADLFKAKGFAQVTLEDVAGRAGVDEGALRKTYPDVGLLGAAWLGFVHETSEARHRRMLERADHAERTLRDYFADLKTYLETSGYLGCPFSALGQESGRNCSAINEEVAEHKRYVLGFFRELCGRLLDNEEGGNLMGEALFLLYSGATVESANMQSTEPAEHALRVFDATVPMWKARYPSLATA